MRIIPFPKDEWTAIQERFREGKQVYTIRVSEEYGRYKEGDMLETEWGETIKVLQVERIVGGIEALKKQYAYFDELTKEMLSELKEFHEMEILTLEAVYQP